MAAAMRLPRYGSSPEPSEMRPQRGSTEMSHMGEYVHCRPAAAASVAAMRALWPIPSTSHEAAMPRLMGKMVRKPWMTSKPNRMGMPRRVSSTATRWISRVKSAVKALRSAPQRPSRMSFR